MRLVAKEIIKFRWRGWRQFAYDFLVIQIGFLLYGLSINMMVQANLGLNPWDVLHMALTYHLPVTLGQASIGIGFLVVLLDVILREPLGWGTITNMIFIGVWLTQSNHSCPRSPPSSGSKSHISS